MELRHSKTFNPRSLYLPLSLSLSLLLLPCSQAQLFGLGTQPAATAATAATATPGLAATTTVPAVTVPRTAAVPGATVPGTTALPAANGAAANNGGLMGLIRGIFAGAQTPAAANTAVANPAATANQFAAVRPAAGNPLTNPFGGAVAQNPDTRVNPVTVNRANPVVQAQTPWNPLRTFQQDRLAANQALTQNNQFSIFSKMFNALLNRANPTGPTGMATAQPQPMTIFAPTNRAILSNLGTLGRNFFNLPQMLQNHVIRGAFTPQQLNNVPPGTQFQGLFGAAQNPIVRAAARNGAALAMRTANNQVVRAQIGRMLYRGRYLVLYGIDSFLYG